MICCHEKFSYDLNMVGSYLMLVHSRFLSRGWYHLCQSQNLQKRLSAQQRNHVPSYCMTNQNDRLPKLPTEKLKGPETQKTSSQLPQIFVWVFSLLIIIGIFYSIVFYAGAGFFYLVRDKITFTKKDFIPYSERVAMEKDNQDEGFSFQKGEETNSQDAQELLRLLPTSRKE
eukprot:TRINITY_DN24005_c0_g1_i2.p1 TRINITY_DN24005_c0_g1~~TRINITY_DN24005_c0_g1_i2.p1  ORF type:complete len:180 (-),score=3.83 TRINITY_DN24005_c0_g1_i2:276-791(-)